MQECDAVEEESVVEESVEKETSEEKTIECNIKDYDATYDTEDTDE